MKRFLRDPDSCAKVGHPVLADLVYGWGNERWSAMDEYLAASLEHALRCDGPVLECGSGLSTLLLGVVTSRTGSELWVLEHLDEWGARVQEELTRWGVEGVNMVVRPLQDYGDYAWYDPPLERLPERFALVVCDGPPGTTKGGRFGLVPVLGQRIARGCTILLDDAARAGERTIAARWAVELGGTLESLGTRKPFFRLVIAPSSATA